MIKLNDNEVHVYMAMHILIEQFIDNCLYYILKLCIDYN